jgi:hypothetical protein
MEEDKDVDEDSDPDQGATVMENFPDIVQKKKDLDEKLK